MIVDKACFERGCACYDDRADGPGVEVVKKEWVGLTDEDERECLAAGVDNGWRGVMKATEAKLRSKNT